MARDGRDRGEEVNRLLDRHVQDLGDGPALVVDLQGLPVVPGPVADLTGDVHVRQEVHLDLDRAVTGAVLAATTLDVEGEPARLVAAHLRLRCLGEQPTDVVEDAGVGGRVRPGCPPDRRLVDVDHLVDVVDTADRAVPTGDLAGVVELLGQCGVEDAVDQGGLARPGHTGDRDQLAQRDVDAHALQVVLHRLPYGDRLTVAGPSYRRQGDLAPTGEVLPGQRVLGGDQLGDRTGDHHLASVLPRPRADVDHPVGGMDGVLVVLHHDQGVAELAEPDQGVDETTVVALVQTDAGLVEHVQHPDQAGADLGRQPDPLGLTTGEAAGGPRQGQVVQPDVEQEPQPLLDLLDDPFGDLGLARAELQPRQELGGLRDRHRRDLGDVASAHGDRQRRRLEPGPLAGRAGHLTHVAGEPLAGGVGLGLGVAPFDVVDHTLELGAVAAGAAVPVAVRDPYRAGQSGQQQLAVCGRQVPPRDRGGEPTLLGQRGDHPGEVVGHMGRRPGRDRPVVQAQRVVGHDQLLVDLHPGADARALRARAPRSVEGELSGLELLHRDVVLVGAGQLLGEPALTLRVVGIEVDELHAHDALGQAQRRLHRVGEALLGAGADRDPVHHHVDVVLELLVQGGWIGERMHLAVDPGAGEALARQLPEQVAVLTLATPYHRGEHLEAGALRQGQQPVHDLLRRLARDRLTADRAVRTTRAGVQQAEVVVDLGDGADRRAWIAAGRLLVDRDRRGEPLDEVDVGLVHLAEELAGIGRQGLHVASLALGKDGVEGERGLPRSGQAGEDDEGVAGQVQRDIAQVVLAGATDDELVFCRWAIIHSEQLRRRH